MRLKFAYGARRRIYQRGFYARACALMYQLGAALVLLSMSQAATAASAAAAPAAPPAPRPPQSVVAFGDSLMAGYQLKPGEGFAPQLEAALRARGRAVTVHNAGVSGDTSTAGRARLNWVLAGLKAKPDLVILELGANDMLRGQDPAITRANLDAMLAELGKRRIKVVLAGMRASPNLGAAYVKAFDGLYAPLAGKYKVTLYPFFMAGVAATPKLQLADGMHPNPAGVAVVVRGILPSVEAALGAK